MCFDVLIGECWSGENADKTYSKDGSSEFCITKEFAQCGAEDRNVCCGNKTTTFIYSIQENYEAKLGNGRVVLHNYRLGCVAVGHRVNFYCHSKYTLYFL